MDDVLDHIRTLHNSRDIHGYLSLLVSIRWERVFGMRWKENGNVDKGGKRSIKVCCLLNMGLAASGARRCFVWRRHASFLSVVIGKSKKEDGTAQ